MCSVDNVYNIVFHKYIQRYTERESNCTSRCVNITCLQNVVFILRQLRAAQLFVALAFLAWACTTPPIAM